MIKSTIRSTTTLILIILFNLNSTQSQDAFDPDLLCTLIANGTKIKDPRFCNTSIQCIDQKPISSSCGDQFYDRNTEECVDPETIKCLSTDPCIGRSDGFVADPYSCNGYYYCLNGTGSHGQCTTGMNYNPVSENCIRNFPCSITMYPEDYCNIVPSGEFIGVPGSCVDYQTCWNSELINGTCPDGFYFDAFRGVCDYPSNVECAASTTPSPDIPHNVTCTENGVFISDGYTCDGYYYCNELAEGGFEMLHANCPVDRFFVEDNGGECISRTSIHCPYDRCVTLGSIYMQMANINGDGCTGFALCQYGKEIGRAECPDGEYFDEWLQLCTSTRITYVACSLETESTTSTPRSTASTSTPEASDTTTSSTEIGSSESTANPSEPGATGSTETMSSESTSSTSSPEASESTTFTTEIPITSSPDATDSTTFTTENGNSESTANTSQSGATGSTETVSSESTSSTSSPEVSASTTFTTEITITSSPEATDSTTFTTENGNSESTANTSQSGATGSTETMSSESTANTSSPEAYESTTFTTESPITSSPEATHSTLTTTKENENTESTANYSESETSHPTTKESTESTTFPTTKEIESTVASIATSVPEDDALTPAKTTDPNTTKP